MDFARGALLKKNTAPEAALPAHHSAPHPPTAPAARATAARATAAPDQLTAPRGEPRGVFLFSVSTGGRPYHREDYAPIR